MFQKVFSCGGILALAGAMVLSEAGPAQAQVRGGISSPGPRSYIPPVNQFQGGYRYPYYPSTSSPSRTVNPSYGFYPYSSPDSDTVYESPRANSRPAGTSADASAHITARVPPKAELWFQGVLTKSKGSVRKFKSPPLDSGYRYTYVVRARWEEDGRTVTQTRRVAVFPGAQITLNFPARSRK